MKLCCVLKYYVVLLISACNCESVFNKKECLKLPCALQNSNDGEKAELSSVFIDRIRRETSGEDEIKSTTQKPSDGRESDDLCDCGVVPNFKLSELKDLTDPLTLAEQGTSVTNKKQMDRIFRTIQQAEDESREGEASEVEMEPAHKNNDTQQPEYDSSRNRKKRDVVGNFRIVGGNKPATARPWVGFMVAFGAYCGSSLLNSRFILTAAHCLCGGNKPEELCDTDVSIKDHPDLKTQVVVTFGATEIKDWDGTEKPNNGKLYYAIRIFVHPDRVRSEKKRRKDPEFPLGTFDLAIVKLNKGVSFSTKIRPLCLYRSSLGRYNQVVIAGFGKEMYVEKSGVKCWTNEEEPNPFSPCKSSFKHNGEKFKGSCVKDSPMPLGKLCKSFLETREFPSDLNIVNLLNNKNGSTEKCYRPISNRKGWCEIQKSGIKVKTPEYGYCSDNCFHQPKRKIMKETVLDILTPEECDDLTSDLINGANTTIEFCAAKKVISVLKTGTFALRKNGFVNIEKGETSRQYYGGKSTCQGDSGGPVWIWKKDVTGNLRAYQVGIVSRGVGCAWANRPGIYTLVLPYIPWITKVIESGKCEAKESADNLALASLPNKNKIGSAHSSSTTKTAEKKLSLEE